MKPIRIALCLAAAALVVGCQDQVTDPAIQADELTEPAFKAEHDNLYRDFVWDWEDYVPCANDGEGEDILWNGVLRVYTRKLATPSGVQTRNNGKGEFIGLDYDDFMGFGQSSEDVWTVDSKKSQWLARKTMKGDFVSYHNTVKIALVRADGEKITVQGARGWVYDKDGNLVMENGFQGSCPLVDW